MCRQNTSVHSSAEEATAGDESLLIYCKPVELYNILHSRAQHNPSFLRRCLRYKRRARHERRLTAGVVVFNYKDYNNMLQKTEVTEEFSCPFCLMQCASFKGLRFHLCSSHDLFNFEFWVNGEYRAVNVSVNIDIVRSELVAGGVDSRLQTFFFCSKPRRRRPKNLDQNGKHVNIQFLELETPKLTSAEIHGEFHEKDDGEKTSTSVPIEKMFPNGRHGEAQNGFDGAECYEHVGSSFNTPGVSNDMVQSLLDTECFKSFSGGDPAVPTMPHKSRKLNMERSDYRNRALLYKRQFYHSHRVQPMAMEQVMSNQDSEDEVDDDIADLEDRRMLDDFVDVSKDEKQLMHLWNSFVRKQRVIADGHVPWACEAFSRQHGMELIRSQALFWCWRLFMIKLWNHGLLDGCTMNTCNKILEQYRDENPML